MISDEGTLPEHVYRLFISTDGGETFTERSTLPFRTENRVYGTMDFLNDGSLIVYIYDKTDESRPPYVISGDQGKTWGEVKTAYLEKRIRNPQFRAFGGFYFLYGRSGHYVPPQNFVLYTSADGVRWDEGVFLCERKAGHSYYSNSVIVGHWGEKNAQRLLIQASDAYEQNRTNIKHWWIDHLRAHQA